MADYLHGAYSEISAIGTRVADEARNAMVYIGTAPVQQIAGGADNVNKPVLVRNIAEARKYFGYSDDFASYTLCEAMHVHFEKKGVGPLVLINVLDPENASIKSSTQTSTSLTPSGGKVTIANAENIIVDTITIQGKTKGTDFDTSYDFAKKILTIYELTSGGLGSSALTVKYYTVTPASVTDAMVAGTTDDLGTNTGVYAVKDVYPLTGYIPSFIICPGFSSHPTVHAAMVAVSQKINSHWDAYLFTDIPIVDGETAITIATAATWKNTNGYNQPNETTHFPLAKDADGTIYHLSVLRAANMQQLLIDQDGIPYRSASNTALETVENVFFGADRTGIVIDDDIINRYLNKNGIASAAFIGGRWALWGAHSADYTASNTDYISASETACMMLYYLGNDFQARRQFDVDKPMTRNDLRTIVAEEQARLDALVSIGALLQGRIEFDASENQESDLVNGDFAFSFNITTTPLAKSLTARVKWTDEGFVTYYESLAA